MKKVWLKDWFSFFVVIIICLVLLFIVSAVLAVMVRGIPRIAQSLATPEIQFAIKLSLYTSLVSTVFCIFIAIPVAYALVRVDLPLKFLINTLLDLPLALPPLVAGVCLLLFFGTTNFGAWLEGIGLSFVFTVKGIIMVQIFVNLSFMIRVMKAAFLSVNPRLEFIARTLGCTPAQAFFKITLPLSRNGIIAGAVSLGKSSGNLAAY